MTNRFFYILIPISLFTLSCNWAPLTPPGKKVRLLELSEVTTCSKKGKTTVATKGKIIGIPRGKETIAEELIHLARNIAPDLKGDTIVAASPIIEGRQTFTIYKCIDPHN